MRSAKAFDRLTAIDRSCRYRELRANLVRRCAERAGSDRLGGSRGRVCLGAPPAYPAVAKPATAPCADPRAVLAVRKSYDRSARLLVQQALVAHPELKVVADNAQAPGELDFYETIYGIKNFAPKYRGDPMYSEAVIARCPDIDTCNRLAAMFHAVSPGEHIELVCGEPPETTGGFSRVRELALDKLVIPDEKSAMFAYCGRALACVARQGLAKRPSAACSELKLAALRACAVQSSCSDVAACIQKELG